MADLTCLVCCRVMALDHGGDLYILATPGGPLLSRLIASRSVTLSRFKRQRTADCMFAYAAHSRLLSTISASLPRSKPRESPDVFRFTEVVVARLRARNWVRFSVHDSLDFELHSLYRSTQSHSCSQSLCYICATVLQPVACLALSSRSAAVRLILR